MTEEKKPVAQTTSVSVKPTIDAILRSKICFTTMRLYASISYKILKSPVMRLILETLQNFLERLLADSDQTPTKFKAFENKKQVEAVVLKPTVNKNSAHILFNSENVCQSRSCVT